MIDLEFRGLIRFHLFPGDVSVGDLQGMSLRDKERFAVYETHNLLTILGRKQLLTDIGQNANASQWAQYLGIGNGPIVSVSPGDSGAIAGVPGEFIRVANNGYTINVTAGVDTVDIQFFLSTSQGNNTYTNVGIWGNGASSTPGGAGQLQTHALANFTKTSANSLMIDYVIQVL